MASPGSVMSYQDSLVSSPVNGQSSSRSRLGDEQLRVLDNIIIVFSDAGYGINSSQDNMKFIIASLLWVAVAQVRACSQTKNPADARQPSLLATRTE
uniref:Uncharacterized protein n=1 Tax=Timema cristinae TaxID=61476 RepID=A0A7R9DCH3_TIMCR|nr:unnamed protein product [Timema cristinae]